MYQNSNFEELFKIRKKINSSELNGVLDEVKTFYDEVNKNIDRCTLRYKNTVESLLNTFPIKVEIGVNKEKFYTVNGRREDKIERIISALKEYIGKFETIKYLSFLSEEKRNVVFVGPNGCGKTTLLRKLKNDTKEAKIYYFPADRALLVTERFQPKRAYDAFINDLNDNYKQVVNIDNEFLGNGIIQQFNFFINLLERERNEENEKRIERGATEKIIRKWNELVKERELYFNYGLCVRKIGGDEPYPLKYLSSGEKSILYFMIGILLQDEMDYYFIDEPENNLNPAIVSKLWNFIERERPNSTFVYLTHDSDFVASRINSKVYWIEKFDGKDWQWQELKENKDLPQDLMVKLVGNREPVLFCESHNEYKYDVQLFKIMFPEFKVVAAQGCDRVCSLTKAYKEVGLPNIALGIIDCDYKDEKYLEGLKTHNVYHIPFHEIENLLFSEKILKCMIDKHSNSEDKEKVFNEIKAEVKKLFLERRDMWVAKHVAFELRNSFDYRGKIKSLNDVEELKTIYNTERKKDEEIDDIKERYENFHKEILDKGDFNLLLRHLDYKGLLTRFCHILNFGKEIEYENEVLYLLNSAEGDIIIKELRGEYFPEINRN